MNLVDNNTQIISFLISLLAGALYCFFYDFFRVWRKLNRTGAIAVFIQDIIYFIIIAITTFILMLAFSKGHIRFYIIFGITGGFTLYNFTVSKTLRGVFEKIFTFLGKIARQILLTFRRIKGLISSKMKKLLYFLQNIYKKSIKLQKNILKRIGKIVYNK